MQASNTVEVLKRLEEQTYNNFNVLSRPNGVKWLHMVIYLEHLILSEKGLLEAITPADLDALTADNFHTVRHAAESVLHLKQYAF